MKMLKTMMITLMTCLVMVINSFGQEKYTNYYNLVDSNTYNIKITSDDTTEYKLYINMMSLDNLSKSGGIIFGSYSHKQLIKALFEAQAKYDEWVKTAKENNVTSLKKEMNLEAKPLVLTFFKYGRDYHFYPVTLKFYFVIDNNKMQLIVYTEELKSMTNKFIRHDGFVFVFSSTDEITKFLNILSEDKVLEYIKKPKTSDLFKD